MKICIEREKDSNVLTSTTLKELYSVVAESNAVIELFVRHRVLELSVISPTRVW